MFDFSVILSISDASDKLKDSIESIISQTIGFKDHIQLILVDAGGDENSETICLHYQEQFPENITYKKKGCEGIASCRNEALQLADGRYVNFMRSSDKWGEDSFKAIDTFISEAKCEIDVVSCKITFFNEWRNWPDTLNYKYKKSDVIDLNDKPSFIHLQIENCFIRREAIGALQFDTELYSRSDSLFLNTIILQSLRIGVVSSGNYYYRFAKSNVDREYEDSLRYCREPELFHKVLLHMSNEQYGTIKRFILFTIMCELQYRIAENPGKSAPIDAIRDYEESIKDLLQEIPDEIIFAQKNLSVTQKVFVYKLKYGDTFHDGIEYKGQFVYRKGKKIFDIAARSQLKIRNMYMNGDKLVLEGIIATGILGKPYALYAVHKDKTHVRAEVSRYPVIDLIAFNGDTILETESFHIEVPLVKEDELYFSVRVDDAKEVKMRPMLEQNAKVSTELTNSYWHAGSFIIKHSNDKLIVHRYSAGLQRKCEKAFANELKQRGEDDIVNLRKKVLLRKKFQRKKIWIVSDRYFKGGDNGENFFKYAVSMPESKNIDIYFVQSATSPDYERLNSYGKVVQPESEEYKQLFLMADMVISSHAEEAVINPFLGKKLYLRDLMDFDYVYLQHGVLPGDLSKWLHKFSKNMRLFITSTNKETESVLSGNYGYTQREVKLAGMARHDAFEGKVPKRQIIFLPTWRADLATELTASGRDRGYIHNFKNSDFFKFYNLLINDERLVSALKQYSYTGLFYLHPNFRKNAVDFNGNDVITVGDGMAEYEMLLNESALMITDYSSVAFDFGYQRKPIIYSQFDFDIWKDHHSYELGYFDYERDGFGPVTSDIDSTVDEIIKLLERDCKIEDCYKQRADEFFAFSDHSNCQRIYKEVIAIS